ncbi:hypothetical protein AciPR4_1197 [Terriglobus saanensis SP1PR4]|uniref:Uncharacterized protein n=1 Tax=Terriglobus saanensis (strain ATCC BAA-1853 / DSM 23119 / SP1PR4) TaxID=401053 RepID=E8UYD5_TERSS|nr:hypothetical protein AciPR4_1197 [Terriglobus saanensis SP1PR4]
MYRPADYGEIIERVEHIRGLLERRNSELPSLVRTSAAAKFRTLSMHELPQIHHSRVTFDHHFNFSWSRSGDEDIALLALWRSPKT